MKRLENYILKDFINFTVYSVYIIYADYTNSKKRVKKIICTEKHISDNGDGFCTRFVLKPEDE